VIRSDWTVVAICAGLEAFGVHLLFNFPVPELDVVAWLLAGTLVPSVGTRTIRPPAYMVTAAALVLGVAVLVVSLDAFSADLHLRRGVDAENDGDLVEAGERYTKAVSVAPGSTRMLEVESRWLLRQGQPARAVDVARRAVDADRSDPYMAELLGKSLSTVALATGDTGDASEAESVLRGLLASSPYDGSLHLELGTALAAQGRTDEAVEAYERAAAILPTRSEPVRNLALLAEQRGDLDEALELFDQAIERNASDQAALDGRDRVLVEMNQP
jgi:tetratricopeptide (TPR) repeat protein